MNKLCPLAKQPMITMNCMREKCAWYLVHSKQCAIPLIASRLNTQDSFLKGIHQVAEQLARIEAEGFLKVLEEEMEK